MAYEVGDPIPLAVNVHDSAGALADATAVVCTVSLPDGTTATPSVTHVSTGVYATAYVSTLAGRHTVRWVATGTNACVYSDTFYVLGTDPGFIISLAEARESLRMVTTATVTDEDIRSLLASVTVVMEDLCGPILAKSHTETYNGGQSRIALLWAPVVSVSSVIESAGSGYVRTLTEQDPFSGTGFDSFGYTVDLVSGVITRRASGVAINFIPGQRNVKVTYTAGRSTIGANLIRATRRQAQFMWRQEMNLQTPRSSSPADVSLTPSGYLVPNAVKALCGSDLRAPGLG